MLEQQGRCVSTGQGNRMERDELLKPLQGKWGEKRINTKPERGVKRDGKKKKEGRWLILVVQRNMLKVRGGRNNQG